MGGAIPDGSTPGAPPGGGYDGAFTAPYPGGDALVNWSVMGLSVNSNN